MSDSLSDSCVPTGPAALAAQAVPFAVSTAIELCALAWLAAHRGAHRQAIVAGALHLSAVMPALLRGGIGRSQRGLSAALIFTLPLIGAPIAAVMLATPGRGEIVEAAPAGAELPPACRLDDLRRMAEGLSCCEALLVTEAEERRAILATLSRHPNRNAMALLRWAQGAANVELAVEAALALEDVSAGFEARLGACRRALEEQPSFAAALAVARGIAEAIDVGVVDAPLMPALAREARRAFETAAELDPARFDVAAASRARMELALLRPTAALALIDSALRTASAGMRAELASLRHEALLASHSRPWDGTRALVELLAPDADSDPDSDPVAAVAGGEPRHQALLPLAGTEVSHEPG